VLSVLNSLWDATEVPTQERSHFVRMMSGPLRLHAASLEKVSGRGDGKGYYIRETLSYIVPLGDGGGGDAGGGGRSRRERGQGGLKWNKVCKD